MLPGQFARIGKENMEIMNQKEKKGCGRARGWGRKLSRQPFSGPQWIGEQDSGHVRDTEEESCVENN
jgi:hypothetical protein